MIGAITNDVLRETDRAEAKFGKQYELPDGSGRDLYEAAANVQRQIVDNNASSGTSTWADILLEEVYEALAESDPAALRAELLQVAAVAMRWIDAIDTRTREASG